MSKVAPAQTKRIDGIKALDGYEHIYVLGNTASGSALTIVVWRDRASLDAAAAQRASACSGVMEISGMTINPGEIYDTFTVLQGAGDR
jgi:hypothetical protein